MKGKQKRSELSDNEPDKNSTTTPTTISKPDTHEGGTKLINTLVLNQRPEPEASTQPLHHVQILETLQERSPATIATSSPSSKTNLAVSGDSVDGVKKASANQETIHLSGLSDTNSGYKDSTFKDKDTNKDNVPDMEKVGHYRDEKPTKMDKIEFKTDPDEVVQNEKHEDTVIERAKEGYTTPIVEEENEDNSKLSYKQYRRYSGEDHPRSRQTGREPNTDNNQQDPLPKGKTETTLEKKRNDADKTGFTNGIRYELSIAVIVASVSVLVAFSISSPNQELKELKERLDKLQEGDDSVDMKDIPNIKQELRKYYEKVNYFTQSLKSEIGDLREDLNNKVAQNKQIQDKLEMLKEQHENQAQDMKEMTRSMAELKSKMEEQSGKVQDLGKDISQVQNNSVAHGKAVDTLKLQQGTMREDIEKNKHTIEGIQSDLITYQNDIKNKSFEIQAKMAQADKAQKEFEEQTSGKFQKHDKELDTAFDNLFNKKVAMVVIILILSVIIGLMIAVYILCQNQTRLRSLVHGRWGQNGSVDLSDGAVATSFSPVLEEIPMRPRLRPALGVISFSREYQQLHKNLVQSVMQNWKENLSVEYCTILENRDIPKIPHCRLVVIFVEHSDRYVILEEEGDALGNCNRSTLMAVQKIGAVPVIVYDKDLGSRRLARDQLYNTKIWSVRCQTELIKLGSSNRFFSVHEEFTETQKLAFRNLIEYHLQPNLPRRPPTVNDPLLETAT